MSKFRTPNGNAVVRVPDSQDEEMIARGMTKLTQPKDSTATTKPKDNGSKKPISKVEKGETRTR